MSQQSRQPGFSFGQIGGKVGIALAGLGFIFLFLGYNGAAGQLTLLGQLPYVISGGLVGLALCVLGGAMLIVEGARADRAMLEEKLDLLAEAFLEGQGRTKAALPTDPSGLVVAGSASYHEPGCRLVDGREETGYLTPLEARSRGLKACRVCKPQDATPPAVTLS